MRSVICTDINQFHEIIWNTYFNIDISPVYTVRSVRKFSKLLCYKVNIKFDDIYDVFE